MPYLCSSGLHQTDLFIQRVLGELTISLLPRRAYETRFVAKSPSVGISLEVQSGEDAIASDRIRPYFARPYSLAWLPAGCDVFSRSTIGGEYLKVEGVLPFDLGAAFSDKSLPDLRNVARRLRRCLLNNCHDVQLLDALHEFLELVPIIAKQAKPKGRLEPLRLRRVLEMMESQLAEPLSVDALAAELSLSSSFFSRAFTRTVGCSPHRYLMERRLECARHLLSTSDRPLAAIAMDTGFSSHAHLTRRFAEVYGRVPSNFRSRQ